MLEKTMLIKMNQQVRGTPMFQILTDDQIEQIFFAALDVLEVSGGRIFHEEALALFNVVSSALHVWSASDSVSQRVLVRTLQPMAASPFNRPRVWASENWSETSPSWRSVWNRSPSKLAIPAASC